MKSLIVAFFATIAVATAFPSGLGLGGWGLGLGAPIGLGLGWGPAIGPAGPVIAAPIAAPILAPAIAPAAAVAVTNGGGTIGVSGHGAVVSGPKTAPVLIEGPSGTVKADGLWGPTLAGLAVPAGHGW